MRFRTRTALATGLLLVGLVAFAPLASAQTPSQEDVITQAQALAKQNGGTKVDQECLKLLAEGKSADDCQQAPSPIAPAKNEFIWGAISFTLLFLLMRKFAYPAIKKGMNDRTERIRSDLDSAETAKTEAATVLESYRGELAGAKTEGNRIIEDARKAAEALKKDQEARLQTELAEVRARAMADIDAAKAQAMSDLKGEVAELAVGAASVVVHKNLDPATQSQLIEDYINQVSTSR